MGRLSRSEQILDNEFGLVHYVNRSVRRVFLCGVDREIGKSDVHWRQWLRDRLEQLVGSMLIDICGCAAP